MRKSIQRSIALAFALAVLGILPTLAQAQGSGTVPSGGGSANPMWTPETGDSYVMPEVASRYGSLPGSFFFHTWLVVGYGSPRLSAPWSFAIAAREPRALRPSSRQ